MKCCVWIIKENEEFFSLLTYRCDLIKTNTTQHNTTQHNTTQHNTTQHRSVVFGLNGYCNFLS